MRLRRAVFPLLFFFVALIPDLSVAAEGEGDLFLSELQWVHVVNGLGPLERDQNNGGVAAHDGTTLTIGGRKFARGLGGHALSEVVLNVPTGCGSMRGYVGIDDRIDRRARRYGGGTATFQVWAADEVGERWRYGTSWKVLFASGRLDHRSEAKAVHVDVGERSQVMLRASGAGDGNARDVVDWGGIRFSCGREDPSSAPPPAAGYFDLAGVGSWSSLPSGTECKSRVHRSSWEPRPENSKQNSTVPDPATIDFESRPRAGGHDSRWDSWLLPRVDGNFTGTTDEIFQWAACKWGLQDNLIRAIAAAESTWYQYLTYSDGTCYETRGCGDLVDDPRWCDYISTFGTVYPNPCPATFGIAGVMARHPWDPYPDQNNGTWPHNRDSTAFAVDYLAAVMRGCYEGWTEWLEHIGYPYTSGDIWGCVGVWYSGEWHTERAERYIATVKDFIERTIWLEPSWMDKHYEDR